MISTVAFGLLILYAVTLVVLMLRKIEIVDRYSHYLLLAVAVLIFANIIERSISIRFAAITNTFEALLFFSGVLTLLLFLYRIIAKKHFRIILFGGTVVAIGLMAIASSPIAPKEVVPPIPALQSAWLTLHVAFSFIGEAFFAVAFVAAIYYLAVRDEEKRKNIDRVIYTSIAIGYPIFTIGALIFGAIWAQSAWGTYWSWDPKETWALITWLVYTAYLHSRLISALRGKVSAVLSIVGFLFTLFTFFGVNYLLSGLHSYA